MLNEFGEVENDASLEKYNTYGIKTKTKYLIKPDDIDKLLALIKYLNKEKIKYIVLGNGSNVILPDNKFNGVVISLEKLNKVMISGTILISEAGISLNKLINYAILNDLGGLETLSSIPGTLGGSIKGNASFYKEHDIFAYLESVIVIRDNKLITVNAKDIKHSYRYSEFKENNDIIVKACFNLYKCKKEDMLKTIKEINLKRMEKQPLNFKNAGSVFKNPEGHSAGKLIEDCGLKGMAINDAEVSTKHANFIINKGNATSKDIKELINIIKEKVKDKFNITLELEQVIIEWD